MAHISDVVSTECYRAQNNGRPAVNDVRPKWGNNRSKFECGGHSMLTSQVLNDT